MVGWHTEMGMSKKGEVDNFDRHGQIFICLCLPTTQLTKLRRNSCVNIYIRIHCKFRIFSSVTSAFGLIFSFSLQELHIVKGRLHTLPRANRLLAIYVSSNYNEYKDGIICCR